MEYRVIVLEDLLNEQEKGYIRELLMTKIISLQQCLDKKEKKRVLNQKTYQTKLEVTDQIKSRLAALNKMVAFLCFGAIKEVDAEQLLIPDEHLQEEYEK